MDDGGKLPLMAQQPPDEEIGDALRVAREALPQSSQDRFLREHLAGSAPQYEPSKDFPARAERAVQAVDRYAGMLNDLAARGIGLPKEFQHPQGRSAREIVESALPQDPNSVVKQAMRLANEGDRLGAAETMLGGIPETGSIRAYHGSPHLFDKFDISKIGTGEGAQAYGHGLYFAENEDIAAFYRNKLAKNDGSVVRPDDVAVSSIKDRWDSLVNKRREIWKKTNGMPTEDTDIIDAALDALHNEAVQDTIKRNPHLTQGSMYEVEIAAEPHQLIDYHKPLSKQPLFVQERLLQTGWSPEHMKSNVLEGGYVAPTTPFGSRKYAEAGIPGIQYLDAGSRGAGEGTRNYVIFDPSIIDIKRRYADGGEVSGDDDVENALRIAKHPVRYDTGPQPGEETIRPYGPTIKDQIYQTVAGTESRPSAERANFARGVSQLAEYTPFLGNAMAGQEAYRRGDTKGMLMSVVPMPGGARAGGVVRGVEEDVIQKPLMAIHNTTLDNLALAESAGGFPATSTAIKDTVSPYRGFGDISLIGDKEFAYPSKMQRIFAGDPYTPNPVLRNRHASKIAEEVASIPHRLEPEKVFTPAMVRAVLTPEFNSFQDIKGKSYLLGSREREGKFVDSFDGYMKDLGERMLPFYKGESSFPEISFYRSLVDPKHRAANFRKLPEDIEQEIAALPSMVEKAPQEYFESKNYGAANIGPGYVSYKGAIIPEGQVSAAQDILNKLGIDDIVPVKSFYHGDDLSKAYEKFKHLHFSSGGQVHNHHAAEGGVMASDDEDVQNALRLAKDSQVKYDTGPQPGEPTLSSYDPTIKERIYQGVAGTEEIPSPERAGFARGVSQLAEYTPFLGNVMAGQEAYRRGDTKGMLMAAVPMPGAAKIEKEQLKNLLQNAKLSRIELLNRNLPDKLRHAINQYSGSHYDVVNKNLRGELEDKILQNHALNLTEKLKKSMSPIQSDMTVYRGIESPDYIGDSKSFLSTSLSPSQARLFSGEYGESGPILKLRLKSGTPAAFGDVASEKEVILPPGKINIHNVTQSGPFTYHHGTYEPFSTGGTASGTMNDDIKSALRLANSRLGRDHDQIDSAESNFPPVIDDVSSAGEEANPHDIEFTPEELELLNSLQDYVEAPAEATQNIAPKEPSPAQEIPERKLGGKINTIIDRDPDWRMGVEEGGVVDRALRLSRDHMAYGGLPDNYMDDDRYKVFQQMGGTRVDPRSEAIGRYLPKMTYHESRDNPLAGARTSSAAGLAQFTRPTWRKITEGEPEAAGKSREELYAMRRDPSEEGQRFHMRMAEKLTNENANKLEQAGLPVTPQNLYAAHFGGPHGIQAAAAPAGTPLNRIFSRAEINANPFLRGRTAEGFRKFTQSAMSETPRGLPTDMDFQRSQLPANRYEGLQTAMAGAPAQSQMVASAQQPSATSPQPQRMAYAQPAQRGFSPDLMTPRPTPQPTQMARLPDMNVGNQRVVASDNMPRQQMAATQPSMPQSEAPQTPTPEPEMPNRDMMEGIEQPFFGLPDFDIAGLFADGGAVEEALHLATGGRTPAWQRKEGKNPKGGLNAKGRASAKAQGMNLKPPAPHPKTEKDANRRKSFCARMSGMPGPMKDDKGEPTRKALSLRAWNCADGGQVWDKPRPKSLGEPKPLSDKQKKSAKAAAKAAGRPYPNFVDNVRAAQKRK